MRRIFFRCGMLCMLASSMMFTSCLQEEDIVEMVEDKYNHDFKETFGKVDPNHTWSTATISNAYINIAEEGDYTLKLYTSNPRNTKKQAYLLGEYNIKGSTTSSLQFDMPVILKNVYAALIDKNGKRIVKSAKVENGKINLSFGGSKIGSRAEGDNSPFTITYTAGRTGSYNAEGQYWEYDINDCNVPLTRLPEGKENIETVFEDGTILHKNFMFQFENEASFTLYPFYFVTSNSVELGLYYNDENGQRQEIAIWQRNTDGVYKKNNESNWYKTNESFDSDKNYLEKGNPFKSEGINIRVAAGTIFGFYITANITNNTTGNNKLYSQAALNNTKSTGQDGQGQPIYSDEHFTYAATYHNHEKGEFYLTFEDWDQNSASSDKDFNDLVVRIDDSENEMTIIDEEEEDSKDVLMEYIVAYEDLGTNDFDFNDVVVGFSHDNKQNEAYIRVLAVGGTLRVYLKGENTEGKEEYLFGQKELHELLGGSTNRPIISHNLNIVQKLPTQIQDANGNGYSITEHFKHFKVEVHRKSGIETEISIPDTEKNTGDAPQAFVVADPAWIWPNESQFIGDKYPNFINWIENNLSEEGANWYGAEWNEDDSANSGGTGGDNTGGGSGEGGETPDYGTPIYSSTETIDNGCTFSGNNLTIPNSLFQTYKETGCTLTFIASQGSHIQIYVGGNSSNGWIEIFKNISNANNGICTIPYIVNITTDQMQQFEELYPNKDKIITLQDGANSITEIYIK